MATFGTVVWGDGLTGRQPWRAAAELGDTLRFGVSVAGIDYYDDMDNFEEREIRHAIGGGWYHSRYVTVKAAYEHFSALGLYFEQIGRLSVGSSALRYVAFSLELQGMRAGLRGYDDERETVVEMGATAWVPLKYVALSLAVEHITLEDAASAGFKADPAVRLGVHTRRHRWGALGAVAEVVAGDERLVRFAVGEEFWVHPMVGLGAGLCTEPLTVGFGATVVWRRYGTNVSFAHHPALGWSKGFEVDWAWGRERR